MGQHDDAVKTAIRGLRPARSGWGRTNCPFCASRIRKADGRNSFAFYFVSGFFKCFRCAIKGRLGGYVTDYKDDDFTHEGFHSKNAPDWFMSSTSPDALGSSACAQGIKYAESRGFDFAIRSATGLGLCVTGKYAESIVVPHRSSDGDWWGFSARKWFKKCSDPYRYPDGMTRERLFNDQVLAVDTDDPVLLVEGVLDGLLYWPDCLGGLGKPIEDHVVVLKTARRPIAVVLDGDAWREGERFMMRLRMEGLTAGAVRMPPGRDPNDRAKIDPADVRRAALESLTQPGAVPVQETQ